MYLGAIDDFLQKLVHYEDTTARLINLGRQRLRLPARFEYWAT